MQLQTALDFKFEIEGKEMGKNDSKVTRRDLLKSATIAGAGLSLSGLSFG